MNVFAVRAAELAEARPELAAAVEPLLKAREAIESQIADLDRKVMRLARNDIQVRRFMTASGVGPITALCFLATIDNPTREAGARPVHPIRVGYCNASRMSVATRGRSIQKGQ